MTELLSPCIETSWWRMPNGYGRRQINLKRWYAHRYAWTLANGPIPPGMHVCHRCDNPPCINVEHLFLGTDLDNAHDRAQKGRGGSRPRVERPLPARRVPKSCHRGHPLSGSNAYVNPKGHVQCRTCKNENQNAKRAAIRLSRLSEARDE